MCSHQLGGYLENKMNELEIWVLLGNGRLSKLANLLKTRPSTIHNKYMKVYELPDEVRGLMNKIEMLEMRSKSMIECNILKAAKATTHENETVRKRAYFALVAWSEIYGGFKE